MCYKVTIGNEETFWLEERDAYEYVDYCKAKHYAVTECADAEACMCEN